MNKLFRSFATLSGTASRCKLLRSVWLAALLCCLSLVATAQVGNKGKPVSNNNKSVAKKKPPVSKSPTPPVREADKREAATSSSKTSTGQPRILLWKVGSPHEGDTPDPVVPLDIQLAAKALNYQVEIETFPASGFAKKYFEAVVNQREPDILAFDNYGIIEGITTKLGNFAGIGTDRRVSSSFVSVTEALDSLESGHGGWEYLISTSRNHEAARNLVRQNLKCDPNCGGDLAGFDQSLRQELSNLAVTASQAYLSGDLEKLRVWSKGAVALDSVNLLSRDSKINRVNVCGLWGNVRLAFVYTSTHFEGAKSLGQKELVVVLKKGEAGWQLLSFSDRQDVVAKLQSQVRRLSDEPFNIQRPRLSLLNPPDKSVHKRWPQHPTIEWSSAGTGVAVYLVESQFLGGQQWSEGYFWLTLPAGTGEQSVKITAPFGIGAQPHRWRVWAIFDNGDVTLSEWRTLDYSN